MQAHGPSGKRSGEEDPRVNLLGVRALIVDEPVHAQMLGQLLAADGCETRSAPAAPEAFPVLSSFQPHAVVLELVLPGMSGLVLARMLKADPNTRDLVLVAMSSIDGPAVERMAIEVGCTALMRKPIDQRMFRRTLAWHLKGRL
jgi:CheY-like chemotaxis protein